MLGDAGLTADGSSNLVFQQSDGSLNTTAMPPADCFCDALKFGCAIRHKPKGFNRAVGRIPVSGTSLWACPWQLTAHRPKKYFRVCECLLWGGPFMSVCNKSSRIAFFALVPLFCHIGAPQDGQNNGGVPVGFKANQGVPSRDDTHIPCRFAGRPARGASSCPATLAALPPSRRRPAECPV